MTPPAFEPFDKEEWIFKYFDDNNNGFLEEAELKAAFEALGQPADDAVIKHSFSLIDPTHDGKVPATSELTERQKRLTLTVLRPIVRPDLARRVPRDGVAECPALARRRLHARQ